MFLVGPLRHGARIRKRNQHGRTGQDGADEPINEESPHPQFAIQHRLPGYEHCQRQEKRQCAKPPPPCCRVQAHLPKAITECQRGIAKPDSGFAFGAGSAIV